MKSMRAYIFVIIDSLLLCLFCREISGLLVLFCVIFGICATAHLTEYFRCDFIGKTSNYDSRVEILNLYQMIATMRREKKSSFEHNTTIVHIFEMGQSQFDRVRGGEMRFPLCCTATTNTTYYRWKIKSFSIIQKKIDFPKFTNSLNVAFCEALSETNWNVWNSFTIRCWLEL